MHGPVDSASISHTLQRKALVNTQENEQEFDPFANEKKPRKPGSGLALLALLLATASVGFSAWQWWQNQSVETDENPALAEIRRVDARQNDLQQGTDELAVRLAELEAASAGQRDTQLEVSRLRAEFAETRSESGAGEAQYRELRESAEQLDERAAALEAGLAALAVRGESPEKRIELAQVDFLLRTANERLQLFGDASSADQALMLADGQLEALDDPLYLPVRRSIATARLSLERMPSIDTLGLTARLAALQESIAGLPFTGQAAAEPAAVAEAGAEPEGIWARVKAAMSGLVTVRRRVPEESLINLKDRDYVRQGLWLQIESARLALMRGDTVTWQRSIERADATLEQYFEASDGGVTQAREDLARLSETNLEISLPDISEPWATLNLLRTGRPDETSDQPETTPDQLEAIPDQAEAIPDQAEAAPGPTTADGEDE
jgi:uncharacterized protein HemX